MTPKRKKRLILIALMVAGVGVAITVALKAFNENLMFFYTPSAVAGGEAPAGHLIRVGGLVTNGSVKRQADGLTVTFDITDYAETIKVQYTGILPDLFREGQGIVATRDDCRTATCSSPRKCSPSTTRTTCRRKSPTRSRPPKRTALMAPQPEE